MTVPAPQPLGIGIGPTDGVTEEKFRESLPAVAPVVAAVVPPVAAILAAVPPMIVTVVPAIVTPVVPAGNDASGQKGEGESRDRESKKFWGHDFRVLTDRFAFDGRSGGPIHFTNANHRLWRT